MLWLIGTCIDLTRRACATATDDPASPAVWTLWERFRFDPWGLYAYRNIRVGDYVNLGYRPILMAALSGIRIGDHVIFGPEVMIIGGNHNTSVPGRFMCDVYEKAGSDDLDIVIEDDVWVGARAVILRGVTIGRGSVIGAGSIVTKSVPPYAVVAGNPAKVIRFRWDVGTILRHEQSLYPAEQRHAPENLQRWQAAAAMLPPARV